MSFCLNFYFSTHRSAFFFYLIDVLALKEGLNKLPKPIGLLTKNPFISLSITYVLLAPFSQAAYVLGREVSGKRKLIATSKYPEIFCAPS